MNILQCQDRIQIQIRNPILVFYDFDVLMIIKTKVYTNLFRKFT